MRCPRCQAEIDPNFKACPHCGEAITDFLRRYTNEPIDGKYRILERLGGGGMGDVYKAEHVYLGAMRVIKVIRPQISSSPEAHERFLREARLATKVQHQNVATLHDFSALPDGSHYMVSEFIDGENLAQVLKRRGTLPPREAIELILQALRGLDAVHRAGIVHRDISPENLMLCADGTVKLIDLGVAKGDDPSTSGTQTGIFLGKVRYASPEQLGFLDSGEKIDGRADLYAVAIVLYEMLTGRPPFDATTPHQLIMLHSRETEFKPLDLPENTPGGEQLQAVLARALDRNRDRRFASARELAVALEGVLQSMPAQEEAARIAAAVHDDATIRLSSKSTPLPSGSQAIPVLSRDTLHRTTQRSEVLPVTAIGPGPTTAAAPVAPQGYQAAPTLLTPAPAPIAQPRRRSLAPLWIASGIAALLLVGIVAVVAIPRVVAIIRGDNTATTASVAPNKIQTATTQTGTAAPSSTSIDVAALQTIPPATISEGTNLSAPVTASTTTPTQATTTVAPATTTRVQRVQPAPTPAPESEPEPEPVAEKPQPEPAPQPGGRTYVEGGDSTMNEEAIAELQRQMQGVDKVAIQGSGDGALTLQLMKLLHDHLSTSGSADVVIHFNGSVTSQGLGRKTRRGTAYITKRGRTIFTYRMDSQTYRVGDNPAEAFARVISDVLR